MTISEQELNQWQEIAELNGELSVIALIAEVRRLREALEHSDKTLEYFKSWAQLEPEEIQHLIALGRAVETMHAGLLLSLSEQAAQENEMISEYEELI